MTDPKHDEELAEEWVLGYDSHYESSTLGLRRAFLAGLARGREEAAKEIWTRIISEFTPYTIERNGYLELPALDWKRIIFGDTK